MKKKFALDWILEKYYVLFDLIKISENLVQKKFEEFYDIQPNNNGKDFLWSLFQFLIIETSKTSKNKHEMYFKHSHIYFEMAHFRRKYENSKANDIFQLKLNSELRSFRPVEGFKIQAEIISNKCCDYCESKDGEKYDIEDAIKNMPYDAEKCTWKYGCRSCYCMIPARDKNGRLIRID